MNLTGEECLVLLEHLRASARAAGWVVADQAAASKYGDGDEDEDEDEDRRNPRVRLLSYIEGMTSHVTTRSARSYRRALDAINGSIREENGQVQEARLVLEEGEVFPLESLLPSDRQLEEFQVIMREVLGQLGNASYTEGEADTGEGLTRT